MALSRPVVLALFGAIFAAALFYATSGARKTSDEPSRPAPPAARKDGPGSHRAQKPRRPAGSTAARPPAAKPPAKAKPRAAAPTVPAAVTRALAHKRTVVLFFFQRGSADDDATASAVASLKGRRGVQVFSAPISRLARYRGVTAGAGVSQAPAVVIVGPQGKARLIEGFIDGETLAQEVTDSR